MESSEKILRLTIDIPLDMHKKLKALAAIHEKSMRDIVIEGIEKQIQKLDNKQNEITFNS